MQMKESPDVNAAKELGIKALIKNILVDKHRKPIPKILHEMLTYGVTDREFPRYYITGMFYRKDVQNPLDHIGMEDYRKIRKYIKDPVVIPFLRNKLLFRHHLSHSSVPLPAFLGYNIGRHFFSPHDHRFLDSQASFADLVEGLLAKAESSSIFVKPADGIQGQGCFKIDSAESSCLGTLYKKICATNHVFEETLVQHPLVSDIYPHSLNTLRIVTCMMDDERVELVSALMRLGANQSIVDNASNGGMFIGVDLESGRLASYARQFFAFGGNMHTNHPDTGFRFDGFTVPHFQAALATVKTAAAYLPYRLVGWDIAITEKGPVLMEGNHNAHILMSDMADGGYKRNAVFKSFLDRITI